MAKTKKQTNKEVEAERKAREAKDEADKAKAQAEYEKKKAALPAFSEGHKPCPKCGGRFKVAYYSDGDGVKSYVGWLLYGDLPTYCAQVRHIKWKCDACGYQLDTKPLDAEKNNGESK